MMVAELSSGDAVALAVHIAEGIAAVAVTLAVAYFVIRGRQQDLTKRQHDLDREQEDADYEQEKRKRAERQEERDHVNEELRRLLDEARAEIKEIRRDEKKSREVTARQVADVQAAHHECEKKSAALAERADNQQETIRSLQKELFELRNNLQTLMNQRATDERRINELEQRSTNGDAPTPESDRG